MRRPSEGWRSARSQQQALARRPAQSTPAGGAPAASAPATTVPPNARGRGGGRRVQAAASRVAAPVVEAVNWIRGWPLRGVEWSLSLLAFFVYIIIITTYAFPGGDVAMAVALVGLLFIADRITFTPVLGWLALYIAWAAVGYVQAPYQDATLDWLIQFGKLWLIALVATTVLVPRLNARLFMVLFLGCYALYPTRGAIFNYLGGYTVFGRALWNYIYRNPNDLAALTLLQLSMAVGLLKAEGEKWIRYCAYAGVGLLPLLILMTQSRGAFIALALFGLLYLAAQRGRRVRTFVALGVLAAVVGMIAPSGVWERMKGLRNATSTTSIQSGQVDREGSARQRYEIWIVAGRIIRDHPVTGVGLGAYPFVHQQYAAEGGPEVKSAHGKKDTHSTYLNVAAETGIPGLLIFLGLVGTTLLSAERVRRRGRTLLPGFSGQLYALELGLVAFLVAGIWGSFSNLSFLYLHLVLVTAVTRQNAQMLDAMAGPRHARGAPPPSPSAPEQRPTPPGRLPPHPAAAARRAPSLG